MLFLVLKAMSYIAVLFTICGGTWLLWASFYRIRRRNPSLWSYLHHIGGIFVTLLALENAVTLLLAMDMSWIEMVYIGLAMFMNCFFAISVVDQLPKRNTRIHRVFAFAVTMGTSIGISLCFQYASYRFHHRIFLKDKLAIAVCLVLILYGFTVTSLDLIDCFLLAVFGEKTPMKCITVTAEQRKHNKSMNGVYRVFVHSVSKIFEKRTNTKRADGEEPMTTIKTPVIWLGLISQMGACIDYAYFNWIIWHGTACKDSYLTAIMLRQQFLLGVVPNVFAMFMATLVFRGKLKVTKSVIAGTAGWLFFAFANLFTHTVIFEEHEQYGDFVGSFSGFWFPLTWKC